MALRRGVVLEGASALDEALGLYVGARYVFIDALDVRAMSFAVSYKPLAKIGQLTIGAALVDGRIVAAVDIAPAPDARGLLLTAAGRNEAVMLLGAAVLGVGSFAAAGPHAVTFNDDEAVVASVERLFSELEGHAWALRHGAVTEERNVQ